MTVPSAHAIALFLAAAGVLVAIPGPNHLYIASRAVAHGRAAGIAAGVGVELGTFVHVFLAAVGLSYVLAASGTAFTVVRLAGAAYLFFLAWRSLRARPADPSITAQPVRRSLWQEVRQGALVNLLNPKVILFFVAFVPQFVDPGRGAVWGQVVVFGALLVAMGFTSNVVYAVASSAIAERLRRRRTAGARRIGVGRFVQAAVYAGLGVLALLTRPATR